MTIKNNISKWTLIAILMLAALLYIRALFNGFAWDDEMYILKNPYLKDFSFKGISAIFTSFYFSNYHPLTTLTYLFEYTLYGANPLPYHLLNILLHLLNTLLVFKITEQLSGKKTTAIAVAILFAVHPMHVESVAWISERKDVLYSLFYLLSLLVYLRYVKSGYKTKFYFGTLLLFVVSLLSKSAAVTFPVLLVAIDLYKGRKINVKSLLEKIPFLLLSLFFGTLTILSQQTGEAINHNLSLYYSFSDRIFIISYAVILYIVKLFIPVNLSAIHYYPDVSGDALPWQYYGALPLLLLICLFAFKKSSFRKEFLFGFFFFLITISVMLQLIPVGMSVIAERYTYIPYIGLFYITGQLISNIEKIYLKKIVFVVLVLFALMFSYLTWERISVWKNGKVLFTDIIKKYPYNAHGYWVRGFIQYNESDYAGALQDFNKSLQIKPGLVQYLLDRAETHGKLNNFKAALDDMNQAIGKDSSISEAFLNRGTLYDKLGDTKSALHDINKAISLNPRLSNAYNLRSVIKAKTGDLNGAMKDINISIKLVPDDAEAYSNRGHIKALLKDYKGSVEDFSYSLKLKPKNGLVYFNRGVSFLYLNDTTGACNDWEKALNLGYEAAAPALKQYCE